MVVMQRRLVLELLPLVVASVARVVDLVAAFVVAVVVLMPFVGYD